MHYHCRVIDPQSRRRCRVLGALGAGAMTLTACQQQERAAFDSTAPASRISAVHAAAATGDRSRIPDLIRLLDSDDAAERLLANQGLIRLTGQDFGFDHAGAGADRAAAAQRWADWYAQEQPIGARKPMRK